MQVIIITSTAAKNYLQGKHTIVNRNDLQQKAPSFLKYYRTEMALS